MDDLNLMYVFEALWRDRSVSVAAENLGVSQAAVSGSLKRLRQQYGDKMFILVGRRMEPTAFCENIARPLLDALAMVRQTRKEQAPFEPSHARRLFTIRTRDIGEAVSLPPIVSLLLKKAPGIKIRTVFYAIEETLNGLGSGRIDLALGFLPSLEIGIHRALLFSQRYVCVMRADHPIANGKLTTALFLEQEHLLVEYSGSGHIVLERALIDAGARHRIRLRMPQYLAAPHFVIATDLVWMVPEVLAKTLAQHYPLAIKQLPLPLPEFEVAIYWHDRLHRDPANKWLRQLLISTLAEPRELDSFAKARPVQRTNSR
jgi:DNA-binding transcriptional LysR family regulator